LLLEQAADENALFHINWYGSKIDSLEAWQTLMSDALFAIGSACFIFLYLTIHSKSPLLSVVSIFLAIVSIPIAFVISARLSGGGRVTGASFLSLFLIVGLGADVVLVFVSFFESSRAKYGDDYSARVRYLYKTAAKACLATTMTTSASFFANLASVLKPLREFGFFMGLCIACTYLFVLVGLPPVLITNEKLGNFIRHKRGVASDTLLHKASPEDPTEQHHDEPQRFHERLVTIYFNKCLYPFRKHCLIAFM
jgi:predicted RND superfamily exporter protein